MRPRYLLLTCLLVCGVFVAFFTPSTVDNKGHEEDVARREAGRPMERSGAVRSPAGRHDGDRGALDRGALDRGALDRGAGFDAGVEAGAAGAGVGGVLVDPDAGGIVEGLYPATSTTPTTSTTPQN